MTEIRIKRPGGLAIHLRVPAHVDWLEVVTRCAKEFTDSGYIGGPKLPPKDATTLARQATGRKRKAIR